MNSSIEYSTSRGVATIRLNRPHAANAFDLLTARAFHDAVERSETDTDVRAVLLTGAGERFCAGGDVASFAVADDQAAYVRTLATELDCALRALTAMGKPVTAAVHGAVAGAGLALMLSCDLVVAHPTTKFAFAYPTIGLTPDCGLSYLLPRAVGQQRALQFALTGKPASVAQALAWGLVAEESDDPVARAWNVATTMAEGPARALGRTRQLLRDGWDLDRIITGAEEAAAISEMVAGEEAQRLISAFIDR